MIRIVNRWILFFVVGAVAASATFAETIKREVTFSQTLEVNGTVVKKGTYTVTFDDQTNELTIIKGGKVIAKGPARLEKRDLPEGARYMFRVEGENPSKNVLVRVAFKGGNQATLVNGNERATSAQ